MTYKFEQLEIWQRALDYADRIHDLAERLPKHERYNLHEDRGRRPADRRQGIAESGGFWPTPFSLTACREDTTRT
jgi:hypothetical protein